LFSARDSTEFGSLVSFVCHKSLVIFEQKISSMVVCSIVTPPPPQFVTAMDILERYSHVPDTDTISISEFSQENTKNIPSFLPSANNSNNTKNIPSFPDCPDFFVSDIDISSLDLDDTGSESSVWLDQARSGADETVYDSDISTDDSACDVADPIGQTTHLTASEWLEKNKFNTQAFSRQHQHFAFSSRSCANGLKAKCECLLDDEYVPGYVSDNSFVRLRKRQRAWRRKHRLSCKSNRRAHDDLHIFCDSRPDCINRNCLGCDPWGEKVSDYDCRPDSFYWSDHRSHSPIYRNKWDEMRLRYTPPPTPPWEKISENKQYISQGLGVGVEVTMSDEVRETAESLKSLLRSPKLKVEHTVNTEVAETIRSLQESMNSFLSSIEGKSVESMTGSAIDVIAGKVSDWTMGKLPHLLVVTASGVMLFKTRSMFWGTVFVGAVTLTFTNLDSKLVEWCEPYLAKIRSVLPFLQGNKDVDCDSQALTAQSFSDEPLGSVFALLFGMTSFMSVGKTPSTTRVDKVMHMLSNLPRVETGVSSLLSHTLRVVEIMTNYIRDKWLGLEKIHLAMGSMPELQRWCMKVDTLIREKQAGKLDITPANANRVFSLMNEGNSLAVTKMSIVESVVMRNALTTYMSTLRTMAGAFESANLHLKGARVEPLVVCFTGSTGVGKTMLTRPFIQDLLKATLPPEMLATLETDWESHIYARQQEHKYWDGFRGQWVTVYDDFGQGKDQPGQPENEYMDLIRCANSWTHTCHMASLEAKGTTVFRSRIIVCTTNLEKIQRHITSLNAPDAVVRRFDYIFNVKPKAEYTAVRGSNVMLDTSNPKVRDAGFNKDVYEFHVVDPFLERPSGVVWNWEQAMSACVDRYKTIEHKAMLYNDALRRNAKVADAVEVPNVSEKAPYGPLDMLIDDAKDGRTRFHSWRSSLASQSVDTEGLGIAKPNEAVLVGQGAGPSSVNHVPMFDMPIINGGTKSLLFDSAEDGEDPLEGLVAEGSSKGAVPDGNNIGFSEMLDELEKTNEADEPPLLKFERKLCHKMNSCKVDFHHVLMTLSRYGTNFLAHVLEVNYWLSVKYPEAFWEAVVSPQKYEQLLQWVNRKHKLRAYLLDMVAPTPPSKLEMAWGTIQIFWEGLKHRLRCFRDEHPKLFALISITSIVGLAAGAVNVISRIFRKNSTGPSVEMFVTDPEQEPLVAESSKVDLRMFEPLSKAIDEKMSKISLAALDRMTDAEYEAYWARASHEAIEDLRKDGRAFGLLVAEAYHNRGGRDKKGPRARHESRREKRAYLYGEGPAGKNPVDEASASKAAAVKGMYVPGNLSPTQKPFVAQGGVDMNADDVLYKAICRNIFALHYPRREQVAGYVTVLRGNVAVIPAHYSGLVQAVIASGEIQPGDALELRNELTGRIMTIDPDLVINAKVPPGCENKDISAFLLPKKYNSFPDITDKFIHGAVYEKKLNLFIRLVGLSMFHRSECKSNVVMFNNGFARYCGVPVPVTDKLGHTWEISEHIEYAIPTRRGWCGSLVSLVDASVAPGKFVGFHVAGSTRSGVCNIMTRSDVEKLCDWMSKSKDYVVFPKVGELEGQGDVPDLPWKGDFMPLYKSDLPISAPTQTNLLHTHLYEAWGKAKTTPAMLHKFADPVTGVKIDPRVRAIEKYGTQLRDFKPGALRRACDDIIHTMWEYRRKTKTAPFRVYTFEEAIVGIPGEEFFDAIPRNTSAGYPWCAMKGRKPGKKEFFGEGPEFDLSTEECKKLKTRVMEIIERAERGERSLHIFTDNLKDERRPIEKVRAGKTRMISGTPLELLIIFRMYFMDFARFLMMANIDIGCAVGINCFSSSWDVLGRRMKAMGDNNIAGDFQNFDGKLSAELLWAVKYIIDHMYDDGRELFRQILWMEVVQSIHISGDIVYAWTHGLPSGMFGTTIVGTTCGLILVRVAFDELGHPHGYDLIDFHGNVLHVQYGDDNALSVSSEVLPWFNQETLTQFFASMGMTYTSEAKDNVVHKSRPLEEIEFLKRSFRWESSLGRYVPALALDTVLEMPYWMRHSQTDDQTERDTFYSAMQELSLHDQETWDKWAPTMLKEARERLEYVPPLTCKWELMKLACEREVGL
jgi:hypothetical protein